MWFNLIFNPQNMVIDTKVMTNRDWCSFAEIVLSDTLSLNT